MRRPVTLLVPLLVIACRNDRQAATAHAPVATPTPAVATAPVARVARARKKLAVAAEEVAGAIEDRFDGARREIKDHFANRLATLLRSADNQSDYWSVVMDGTTRPEAVREAFYQAKLQLAGENCRFSPGDTVATYECDVGDAAPFADLGSKLAAYADASRQVIPSSWILAGEDGAFHAMNPFCRAEQIRFAASDSLRIVVTLPYGAPCGLPYNASTSKS